MKRVLFFWAMVMSCTILVSCEQPTMLSVSQTALSFENKGGNQSVTLTANKVWTASSNQGWLRVSPSSGEGNATLSVSCEGNTTYDTRTGTITIVSEELTQTISVSQAEGLGLLISQPEYNLSNEAQTIDVTVQANVQYTVAIDNACRDWIKQESTKGLSSNTIKFAISKNESYDGREGKITIRQVNGSLSATVIVKQSQTNGLFADKTEYEVSYEEQQLNIKVKSNVDYDVQIDDSCKDWISRVQTKGLVESTVSLSIARNGGEDRSGAIVISFNKLRDTLTVIQKTEGYVAFEDANFKSYCITNFDINKDGKLSYYEAKKISSIYVNTESIISVKGIEHMPNLESLYCVATWDTNGGRNGKLKVLDVSHNTRLTLLACEGNPIASLDVSGFDGLKELWCRYNKLTSLNIKGCTALTHLDCSHNQITDCLDVSGFNALTELFCEANQLTSINIGGCTALQELEFGGNFLTDIDISSCKGLKAIECYSNQLSRLDVSNYTDLIYLYCPNNPLTYLNVDNCSALATLFCNEVLLENLDVSSCIALQSLSCSGSKLTKLNAQNCTELTSLTCCNNNDLTTIDVRGCVSLTKLLCYNNNKLTSLDVSDLTSLNELKCYDNQLSSLVVSNCPSLRKIDCYNNQLSNLELTNCPALTTVLCYKNKLTALDVSNCVALTSLSCYQNNLTSINVSSCSSLTTLSCYSNNLTALDVSSCSSLTALSCYNNNLTVLDVSKNLELTSLVCYMNPLLKEIWLKKGQTINTFKYDTDVATVKYK